jgi:uncharacterized protein YjbJ (UPF0337 family)
MVLLPPDDISKRDAICCVENGSARKLRHAACSANGTEETMNEDILKGKWRQLKGEVKSRWGKLTDDDVDRVEGDAEKLIGRVQERYGYQRDEAQREVDAFFSTNKDRF